MAAVMEKIGLSALVEVFGPAAVMAVGHSGTGSSIGSIGMACVDGGPFGTADGASRVTGTISIARVMCSSCNVGNGGIGADGEVAIIIMAMDVLADDSLERQPNNR